jgi:hypothetical protein
MIEGLKNKSPINPFTLHQNSSGSKKLPSVEDILKNGAKNVFNSAEDLVSSTVSSSSHLLSDVVGVAKTGVDGALDMVKGTLGLGAELVGNLKSSVDSIMPTGTKYDTSTPKKYISETISPIAIKLEPYSRSFAQDTQQKLSDLSATYHMPTYKLT